MPGDSSFNRTPSSVDSTIIGLKKELNKYKSELLSLSGEPESENKETRKKALEANIGLLENTLKGKS